MTDLLEEVDIYRPKNIHQKVNRSLNSRYIDLLIKRRKRLKATRPDYKSDPYYLVTKQRLMVLFYGATIHQLKQHYPLGQVDQREDSQ